MKHVLYLCSIIVCWLGVSQAGSLYGHTNTEIQQSLDTLNSSHRLNIHVVVLDEGDNCSNETSFALCAVKANNIAGDLVFVVNIPARRFESLLSDDIKPALSTSDLKSMEEAFVPDMKAGDMNAGIISYLNETRNIVSSQCQQYAVTPCHIRSLQQAIQDKQDAEAQQEAEALAKAAAEQAEQTRRIVIYTIIIVVVVGLSYRGWIQYLYSLDKKRINDLHKSVSTTILTIKHDNNLFAEDKKQLQHNLKELLSDVEQVLALTPSSLHAALKQGSNHSAHELRSRATALMKHYTDMTHIISKTDDIARDKQHIHAVDL